MPREPWSPRFGVSSFVSLLWLAVLGASRPDPSLPIRNHLHPSAVSKLKTVRSSVCSFFKLFQVCNILDIYKTQYLYARED